jgi:hypothetical protein
MFVTRTSPKRGFLLTGTSYNILGSTEETVLGLARVPQHKSSKISPIHTDSRWPVAVGLSLTALGG